MDNKKRNQIKKEYRDDLYYYLFNLEDDVICTGDTITVDNTIELRVRDIGKVHIKFLKDYDKNTPMIWRNVDMALALVNLDWEV